MLTIISTLGLILNNYREKNYLQWFIVLRIFSLFIGYIHYKKNNSLYSLFNTFTTVAEDFFYILLVTVFVMYPFLVIGLNAFSFIKVGVYGEDGINEK